MFKNKLKILSILFIILLLAFPVASLSGYYIFKDLMDELRSDNQELRFELANVKSDLNDNLTELEKLRSGNTYELHDPTLKEVQEFIIDNEINMMPYENITFASGHYAQYVNNHAEMLGMRCAFVLLSFNMSSHVIIGFDTVDEGMIYIEPQSDEYVENLVIGNDYWTDCVIPKPGYYYREDNDDTIEAILIFW